MIRLKHNKYPIWISFEGDTETFDKVKQFIAEDITYSGFSNYDAFEDIAEDETTVEATGNDWINKADKPKAPKTNTKQSDTMTATVTHDDGTELSFGMAEEEEEESVEDTIVDGQVPNKEGKHNKGGLGKFADKK